MAKAEPAKAPKRRAPADPPKRQRQPVEVKSRVIAAARQAFALNGFDGATTRSIAQNANVKLPLLLYHFKSKEGLWRAVIVDIMEPYLAALMAVQEEMRGEPAADVLRATVEQMVRHYARRPELHRLMTGEGHRKSRRLTWLCETYVDRLFDAVRRLIVAAQKEGKVRALAPDKLRYAIVSMAAVPFSMRYEYERLTGRKVFSETEKQALIKFINSIVFV
jgi:TetR/AcrR family transcriptional regulator